AHTHRHSPSFFPARSDITTPHAPPQCAPPPEPPPHFAEALPLPASSPAPAWTAHTAHMSPHPPAHDPRPTPPPTPRRPSEDHPSHTLRMPSQQQPSQSGMSPAKFNAHAHSARPTSVLMKYEPPDCALSPPGTQHLKQVRARFRALLGHESPHTLRRPRHLRSFCLPVLQRSHVRSRRQAVTL